MDVIDPSGRLIHQLVLALHPVLCPFDVLQSWQSFVKLMLLPKVAPNGRIRIVSKEIRWHQDLAGRSESPLKIERLAKFRFRVTALLAIDHGDPVITQWTYQMLQPIRMNG